MDIFTLVIVKHVMYVFTLGKVIHVRDVFTFKYDKEVFTLR